MKSTLYLIITKRNKSCIFEQTTQDGLDHHFTTTFQETEKAVYDIQR
jgi:hypothetical protein